MLNVIIYNYSCSFTNLSLYYQTINYLNSKNNIAVILLFLALLFLNKKKSTKSKYINLFSFIMFLYTPLELNQTILFFLNNKANINTNLTNGIMLIHPYILYFFYAIFLNFSLSTFKGLFLKKNKIITIQTYSKKKSINSFLAVYLSIMLGCFWAEQELSWGGW